MDWGGIGDFLSSSGGGSIVGSGIGLLGNWMSSKAKADASEAGYDAWLKWADMFKPSEEEKMAMRERGAKRIRQTHAQNRKALSSNMASRGVGGGQLATGLADDTRALSSDLGELDTSIEIAGFGQAPGSPPPTQLGTGSYMLGGAGDMAQYLGGLTMANSLFGKTGGSGGTWQDMVPGYDMLGY